MIVGNLALKDRVDKSEWYRGYSGLSQNKKIVPQKGRDELT